LQTAAEERERALRAHFAEVAIGAKKAAAKEQAELVDKARGEEERASREVRQLREKLESASDRIATLQV